MDVLNLIDQSFRDDVAKVLKEIDGGEAVLYKLLKNNPMNTQEFNRYLGQLEVPLDQYIEALVLFDIFLVKNNQSADLKRQNGYLSCCLEMGFGPGRLVNLLHMMLMNYGLEDRH